MDDVGREIQLGIWIRGQCHLERKRTALSVKTRAGRVGGARRFPRSTNLSLRLFSPSEDWSLHCYSLHLNPSPLEATCTYAQARQGHQNVLLHPVYPCRNGGLATYYLPPKGCINGTVVVCIAWWVSATTEIKAKGMFVFHRVLWFAWGERGLLTA